MRSCNENNDAVTVPATFMYSSSDQGVSHYTTYSSDEVQQLNPNRLDDRNVRRLSDLTIDIDGGHTRSKEERNDTISMRFVPGDQIPNRRKWVIRRVASVVVMMVIEIGLPLALYYSLRSTIGIVYALVLSGAPPFLYVLYEFIRRRRIDILGCIIGLSFVISGVLSISSGDARAAIIRDSAVGAVIGGMFLISLIPLRTRWFTTRPLTFVIARQILYPDIKYQWTDRYGNLQEQDMVLWRWEHVKVFRLNMYWQTIGWGFLLIMALVACVLLVEVSDLSDDDVVMYNNIITGATTGLMVIVPLGVWVYEHKRATQIGKQWTEENDFTDKIGEYQEIGEENETSILRNQAQQQQQQEAVGNSNYHPHHTVVRQHGLAVIV